MILLRLQLTGFRRQQERPGNPGTFILYLAVYTRTGSSVYGT